MPFKHQQVECDIRRLNTESSLDTSVYGQLKWFGSFETTYLINLLNYNSQNERCVTQILTAHTHMTMMEGKRHKTFHNDLYLRYFNSVPPSKNIFAYY